MDGVGEESLPKKLIKVLDELGVLWRELLPCSFEVSHQGDEEFLKKHRNRPAIILVDVKPGSTSREVGKIAADRCKEVIVSFAREEGETGDVQVEIAEWRGWGSHADLYEDSLRLV